MVTDHGKYDHDLRKDLVALCFKLYIVQHCHQQVQLHMHIILQFLQDNENKSSTSKTSSSDQDFKTIRHPV